MRRHMSAFLLTAVLSMPVVSVLRAGDDKDDHERVEHRYKRYYDADARDWHEWTEHEDQAWHRYWDERREAYHDWVKTNREERREYWRWRHNHPDTVLFPDNH